MQPDDINYMKEKEVVRYVDLNHLSSASAKASCAGNIRVQEQRHRKY